MKIALTGGGTGGHFYPLIAVAEGIEQICNERRLVEPQLFYFGPTPFDLAALAEHDIQHIPVGASSPRKGGDAKPFLGTFGSLLAAIGAFSKVFSVYPDVVFSTGGYAAFPTLLCAKILKIPVVVYDADSKPGRVSLWSAKFARWIAVAHPDAVTAFPEKIRDRMAHTGHPIREEVENPAREGGHEFLKLDSSVPTIFVVGGSQGARTINETVLDALPTLLEKYNVVHQTGTNNLAEVQGIANVSLRDSPHKDRYRTFGLLNALALKMTAGISSIVLSRAGSGTIFEIASWGIPAILVPIPLDVSHDQTENAFSYARAGGAVVIEQRNMTHHVLLAEIDRLMSDDATREKMKAAAKEFSRPQANRKIAQIILETAIEHEPR